MAQKTWRGDAQPIPQVTHVTPASVEIGDAFTLTINRKDVSFTATAATVANVVAGLVAAVDASTLAEFQELTATAGTDDDGNTTHLVLTGPSDGKPFTVTSSTTNSSTSLGVTITSTQTGSAGQNEKQEVSLPPAVSGGTFTLTYDGQTTGNIAYDASAATVDTALEALSNIAAGDVAVTGSAGGPWTIEFTGNLALTDVSPVTGDGANLTGAGSITVTTSTGGHGATNEIQTITPSSGGVFYISWGGEQTDWLDYDVSATDVRTQLESLTSINSGDVQVGGGSGSAIVVEFTGQYAGTDVATLSGEDTDSLGSTYSLSVSVTQAGGQAGTNEVQYWAVNQSYGGTYTLTFRGQTTGNIAYNADAATVETALEAISTITAGDLTVSRATSGASYGYTVTFGGTLAAQDLPTMVGDGANLTGAPVYVAVSQSAASAQNEAQTVQLTGSPSGGTFTLTYSGQTTGNIAYDASASTVDTALEALSNIGAGDVSVTGADGGPWVVEFTGSLAAQDVAAMTGDGANLTSTGSQTFATSADTAASGPNHYDEPENWEPENVPVDGDDIVFELVDSDCLYGLDQSTVTPDSVTIKQSYTGRIGLPVHTGLYYEYRDRYLAFGGGAGPIAVTVGEGGGSGSGRIQLDTNAVETNLIVMNTGSPDDANLPSLLWIGTDSSNTLQVQKGYVGVALESGQSAEFDTLDVGYLSSRTTDAEVELGDDVTFGTVTKVGGSLVIGGESGGAITAIANSAGELTINGTDAVSSLVIDGGTVHYNSTGTLGGNPTVSNGGVLDFSQDLRAKTVTNPIEVYGDEAEVVDPHQVVSSLIVDFNRTTRHANLGTNIRVTRGTPA